jgi:hypothetical protein
MPLHAPVPKSGTPATKSLFSHLQRSLIIIILSFPSIQMQQNAKANSSRPNPATLASYATNILKLNDMMSELVTRVANTSAPLISPPLWLDGRVWTQTLINVNSSLLKFKSLSGVK